MPGFTEEMEQYLGKVFRVRTVETSCLPSDVPGGVLYKLSDIGHVWREDWLEPVEEKKSTGGIITGTIKANQGAARRDAAENRNENRKRRKRQSRDWTTGEIELARMVAHEKLCELYDRGASVVFYSRRGRIVEATNRFGSCPGTKNVVARPSGNDAFNDDIGRCVCLCKLTGDPVPDFIMNKNRG